MAPLIILLGSFLVCFAINRYLLKDKYSLSFIGRLSLSLMLLATGITHFTSTDLMVQMMPDLIPAKRELVYFTGVCELFAVIGLLWRRSAKLTAVMLIIFFVMILPANIAGSVKEVELGGMENGARYLFFRIPLQILFIWWAYYFGISKNDGSD
ncbi:MAG: DoxX family protein [Pyrinomonadaceae bacterium]